ncbi:tRNA pseudouridine synthase B [mine drainage metagenome]|uniref:tRNA pseudouridine synthase B n=1 Tax=mine drainage metagenome TaxID=410659 RepID=A0A1J5PSW7_9ZZZZ
MTESQRLACLLPVSSLLADHAVLSLDDADASRFLNGLRRRTSWPDCERVAVYAQDGQVLLGSAHVSAGELIPGRLLSPIEIEQLKNHPGVQNLAEPSRSDANDPCVCA